MLETPALKTHLLRGVSAVHPCGRPVVIMESNQDQEQEPHLAPGPWVPLAGLLRAADLG